MTEGHYRGVHYCTDIASRIAGKAKAEVVKEGEDLTSLRQPKGAQVISQRSSPTTDQINVDRITVNDDGSMTKESCEAVDMREVVNEQERKKEAPVSELHKDASLEMGIEAMGVPAHPNAEHGVGVQPVRRSESILDHPTPVNAHTQPQEKVAEVQPSAPEPPPTELEPADRSLGVVQGFAGSNPQAAEQMAVEVPERLPLQKYKVLLSSDKMGRHRLRVNKFAVSESVVVLGYVDDDDSVIVEPPISSGQSDTISVTHAGQTYVCVYYGFTFDLAIDGRDMLLVVLVRIPE